MPKGWQVGIDVGGTFTDVIAVHRARGEGESREGPLPHRRPHRGPGGGARRGRSPMGGRGRPDPRHHHRHQRHHPGRARQGRADRDARLLGHARHRAPEPAPPLSPRPAAQAHTASARRAPLRGDRAAGPRRPGHDRAGPGLGGGGDRTRRSERGGGGRRLAAAFLRQPCPRGGAGRAAARALPLRRAFAPGQSRGPRVRADRDPRR